MSYNKYFSLMIFKRSNLVALCLVVLTICIKMLYLLIYLGIQLLDLDCTPGHYKDQSH
jgi:hypothetical protein